MRETHKYSSKSRDFPLYEKMLRQSPRAAAFWMIGDRLYHAGLFLTMLCLPAAFFSFAQTGSGGIFIWMVGALFLSVGIFAFGVYFKRESYRLAVRAGIDITQI